MVAAAVAEEHRVTSREPFLDLVFVFAFTQVAPLLAHEPIARNRDPRPREPPWHSSSRCARKFSTRAIRQSSSLTEGDFAFRAVHALPTPHRVGRPLVGKGAEGEAPPRLAAAALAMLPPFVARRTEPIEVRDIEIP